jgi:hypothetical protein
MILRTFAGVILNSRATTFIVAFLNQIYDCCLDPGLNRDFAISFSILEINEQNLISLFDELIVYLTYFKVLLRFMA